MNNQSIIKQSVEHWLLEVVIGLQLCPFAKTPLQKSQIRFIVSEAITEDQLNSDLIQECHYLDVHSEIETTLLICPNVLENFFDFCQFLNWTTSTLKKNNWQGIYQIAHFHPDYCFAGIDPNDIQNFTNRSPYPILHLLREASLENALNHLKSPENIPEKNIKTMNSLSEADKHRYFYYLF